MNSTEFPQVEAAQSLPFELPDLLALAESELAAHPMRTTSSGQAEYATPTPDQEGVYNATADSIFDAVGVAKEDVIEHWERPLFHGTPVPTVRLQRAVDVAAVAQEFAYDQAAPADEVQTTTATMLDDFRALSARAVADGDFRETSEYSCRRKAMTMVLEGAVRELGRRNNLGDDLTPTNLQDIQDATGLKLVDSEPHSFVFKSVIPARISSGATSQPRPRREELATQDYYRIPELAGPHAPHRGQWVPGRIGSFVLDPRYTGGVLPR
jgi:hypothetical protein